MENTARASLPADLLGALAALEHLFSIRSRSSAQAPVRIVEARGLALSQLSREARDALRRELAAWHKQFHIFVQRFEENSNRPLLGEEDGWEKIRSVEAKASHPGAHFYLRESMWTGTLRAAHALQADRWRTARLAALQQIEKRPLWADLAECERVAVRELLAGSGPDFFRLARVRPRDVLEEAPILPQRLTRLLGRIVGELLEPVPELPRGLLPLGATDCPLREDGTRQRLLVAGLSECESIEIPLEGFVPKAALETKYRVTETALFFGENGFGYAIFAGVPRARG